MFEMYVQFVIHGQCLQYVQFVKYVEHVQCVQYVQYVLYVWYDFCFGVPAEYSLISLYWLFCMYSMYSIYWNDAKSISFRDVNDICCFLQALF